MIEPRTARLAKVTEPERGLYVLNVQYKDGADPERTILSQDQLAGIVNDGLTMVLNAPRRVG